MSLSFYKSLLGIVVEKSRSSKLTFPWKPNPTQKTKNYTQKMGSIQLTALSLIPSNPNSSTQIYLTLEKKHQPTSILLHDRRGEYNICNVYASIFWHKPNYEETLGNWPARNGVVPSGTRTLPAKFFLKLISLQKLDIWVAKMLSFLISSTTLIDLFTSCFLTISCSINPSSYGRCLLRLVLLAPSS